MNSQTSVTSVWNRIHKIMGKDTSNTVHYLSVNGREVTAHWQITFHIILHLLQYRCLWILLCGERDVAQSIASDRSFSVDPAAVWVIFRSKQWSTTGLSKAVVCTVLSMKKIPCCLSKRVAYVAAAGFLLKRVSTWPYEWRPITNDKIKINVFQWRR